MEAAEAGAAACSDRWPPATPAPRAIVDIAMTGVPGSRSRVTRRQRGGPCGHVSPRGCHRCRLCLPRSLDLTGPLLLGGVPNLPEDFPVHSRQFVGCMRNLSIDGRDVDMASFIANNGTRAGPARPPTRASRGCGGRTGGPRPEPVCAQEGGRSRGPGHAALEAWGPAGWGGRDATDARDIPSQGLEHVAR